MKNFLLLLLFPPLLAAQTKNQLDTIHWSEKPLNWDDFKAKPKPNSTGEASVMLEAYYAKPNPLKKTRSNISAVWNRGKSSSASASHSAGELLYYQVLFNLYELHARKLRKEFSETKFGLNPEAEFRNKYNAAAENLQDEAAEYRDETKEGADTEEVKKWDKKINEDLKKLEKYR